MSRITLNLAVVSTLCFAALSAPLHAQSNSLNDTVPTVVVKIEQMAAPGGNSTATFSLVNGKSALALLAANGDIEAHAATDIRFVFDAAQSGTYLPVGITFRQTDANAADKTGARNFPSKTVADGVLTVHASVLDAATFKYSILFERVADGAVGVIDPQVINVPEA